MQAMGIRRRSTGYYCLLANIRFGNPQKAIDSNLAVEDSNQS